MCRQREVRGMMRCCPCARVGHAPTSRTRVSSVLSRQRSGVDRHLRPEVEMSIGTQRREVPPPTGSATPGASDRAPEHGARRSAGAALSSRSWVIAGRRRSPSRTPRHSGDHCVPGTSRAVLAGRGALAAKYSGEPIVLRDSKGSLRPPWCAMDDDSVRCTCRPATALRGLGLRARTARRSPLLGLEHANPLARASAGM